MSEGEEGRWSADAQVTTYSGGSEAAAELAELERMLQDNPESDEVREWRAFRLYTLGKFVECVDAYLELVRRRHRPGVQYFHLGNAYYKMKRYGAARDAWQKTVEHIPTDPKAQKARARLEKLASEQGGE